MAWEVSYSTTSTFYTQLLIINTFWGFISNYVFRIGDKVEINENKISDFAI